MSSCSQIAQLNDRDLWRGTQRAARDAQGALVQLLLFLGEVNRRRLYAVQGFGSLWAFVRSLGFSEGQCSARVVGARVLRRFAWVADDLASGTLHLTAVAMVGRRVLRTDEATLLRQARGLSREQLDALLLQPEPGDAAPVVPLSAARRRARVRPIRLPVSAAAIGRRADPTPAGPPQTPPPAAAAPLALGAMPLFSAPPSAAAR